MTRLPEYLKYHATSAAVGDIDPSYALLRYVADRFELNEEQRYWIAFIYGLTYCGASTFYIYNEFPDFENVDSGRLQRWWETRGRDQTICQTDRRWVRSGNMFVPAVESYRCWVGQQTQAAHFAALCVGSTPEARYDQLYASARQLHSFGQFSLFLYLEALHTITPLDLAPTDLDLSVAHSCRNGLCYAYGYDEWLTESEAPTPEGAHGVIQLAWQDVLMRLRALVTPPPTVWNIETTLCAYKKFKRADQRYIGYYLDRQAVEIAKMAAKVPDGVAWRVLWQFRQETYPARYRAEDAHDTLAQGASSRWRKQALRRTKDLVSMPEDWELTA